MSIQAKDKVIKCPYCDKECVINIDFEIIKPEKIGFTIENTET